MGRHAARAARQDRRTGAGLLCLVLAALTVTIPLVLMIGNGHEAARLTGAHAQAVENADAERVAREYAAARAYNRRLYEKGQSVLGEATDPWTGVSGSGSDASYRRQLDFPADGIMSTIRYPRLGIDLPIRHGTSQTTLDAGAGHMYGTSLPVGGRNTHTVISAHSGLADRLMFDRLRGLGGEARKGDVFYLVTAGHTLAYRVVDISVVDPSDFSKLRIVDGRDLATLLTCTPYGVNNKRLLVTGERVRTPARTSETGNVQTDRTCLWLAACIAAAWLAVATAAAIAVRGRKGGRLRRHARHAPGTHSAHRGRFQAFPFPSGPSARKSPPGPDEQTGRAFRFSPPHSRWRSLRDA